MGYRMVREEDQSVVLLSIKPEYAELILNGEKTVEFRKTMFSQEPTAVVFYATSPVKKVIGYSKIAFIEESSPASLWRRHRQNGGIEYDTFKDYYASNGKGIAIGLADVTTLRTPRELPSLSNCKAPPQSFIYISPKAFSALKTGDRTRNKK
jgi:predicted transcriptional regulator